MDSEKFEYTYSAPTEEERQEIENIRKQYSPTEQKDGKIDRLRRLDRLVNLPPKILGIFLGIAGTLVFGGGMSLALVNEIYIWGSVVGAVGVAIIAIAYPLYKFVLKRRKAKYGQEIIELSNELLNEKE